MSEKALWIRALKENSRLDSPQAIRAFDEALERLSKDDLLRPGDLPDLFRIFRDDCDDEEVMFGLVHLVEDFPLDEFLGSFLDAVPEMDKCAPGWTRTFHYRVLNSEKARAMVKQLLVKRGGIVQSAVEGILRDIAATGESPLSERAQSVLRAQ